MEWIFVIALLVLGYITGTIAERRHYKSIEEREKASMAVPNISIRQGYDPEQAADCWLVYGSAVISHDYFKRFLATLRMFFGGNVASFEPLVDRARREALLRMRQESSGADLITNVRVETSPIGQDGLQKKAIGSVEALAYGTAVRLKRQHQTS